MVKVQSDKKIFQNFINDCKSSSKFHIFLNTFKSLFQVAHHNRLNVANQYIRGLLKLEKGKANMERMTEEIPDSEYRIYQHFLTNSNWSHQDVLSKVRKDTSRVMKLNKIKSKKPTGLIIDESAHLKKGDKSVGVSRQYAGVIGKVDNCQVGVYASLVNDNRAGLVNERLFLPESWVSNKSKCKKAGIPKQDISFKTKPQLALEMIDEMISDGVEFDWVGGDGLYGHNTELRKGLDARGLLFILDVHKDEKVFLSCPEFSIPNNIGKRGRPSKQLKPNIASIRLDKYVAGLESKDWSKPTKIRKTQKGWKKQKIHIKKVWVQEGKNQEVKERTLIVTQSTDGKRELKYSLSNAKSDDYSAEEFAYFQAQRYWVERTFDDAKNELGMSDYQIRKWNGWHHHHALVFMASLFLLQQRIEYEQEAPLMSMRDARILMIVSLFGTKQEIELRIHQMKIRHQVRQKDIDRRYNC